MAPGGCTVTDCPTLACLGSGARQVRICERRSADGDSIWTALKGRTLFVSGSAEALLFAGGLAEMAQVRPQRGHVVLTVMPQALAAATSVKPLGIG